MTSDIYSSFPKFTTSAHSYMPSPSAVHSNIQNKIYPSFPKWVPRILPSGIPLSDYSDTENDRPSL